MGLDMWIYEQEKGGFLAPDDVPTHREEVHYWRKHNALHAWMEDHWRESCEEAGTSDFNCVPFILDAELLDRLEADIKEGNLTPRAGFFFGGTDYDPTLEAPEDLDAVNKAREALERGKEVYYFSWW